MFDVLWLIFMFCVIMLFGWMWCFDVCFLLLDVMYIYGDCYDFSVVDDELLYLYWVLFVKVCVLDLFFVIEVVLVEIV